MEPQLVSVVLVTWNSAPYLRRCLDGIRQQTHRHAELIVVDNASADDSVALVAEDATTVIRNDTNRGFSAAVNQAIAAAKGAYVLLVNPDCHLEPAYIDTLVAAMQPDVGSATGMLIRARGVAIAPTDEIDSCGIRMTRTGRHLDITELAARSSQLAGADGGVSPSALSPQPSPLEDITELAARSSQLAGEDGGGSPSALSPHPSPLEVFGVSGAAALFRRSFLDDVAIDGETFDEDFFAYREDADLAWRGRLFGWRAVCEPRAIAYHVRRVTPEARRELPADINMHSVKNRFLLRLKNEGLYLALRNAPFELARDLVVVLAALTVERTSLPAFGWLWRNRARVLAKRRIIQQRRKVSDRELARWFR
jgi:GT2 family glycosyltransferase